MATTNWLSQPYFTPGPQTFVTTTVSNFPNWFTTTVLSTDSYLQSVLASTLSDISDFLNPDFYNSFNANKTEAGVINDFVANAVYRNGFYPQAAQGMDPSALGTEYGTLMVNIMKHINSGGMTNGTEGKSVWDVWVAM